MNVILTTSVVRPKASIAIVTARLIRPQPGTGTGLQSLYFLRDELEIVVRLTAITIDTKSVTNVVITYVR